MRKISTLLSLFALLLVCLAGCKKDNETPTTDGSVNPFALSIPEGDYVGDLQFAMTGTHLDEPTHPGMSFFGTLYNDFQTQADSSTPDGGDCFVNEYTVGYDRRFGYNLYFGTDSLDVLLPQGVANAMPVEFKGGNDVPAFKTHVSLVEPLRLNLHAFTDVDPTLDYRIGWNGSATYPSVMHIWLEYEPGLTGNPPESPGPAYHSKRYVASGTTYFDIPSEDLREFPSGNLRLSVGTGKAAEVLDSSTNEKMISITYTKAQAYLTIP